MENIFKNAYFGKAYKTRDGRKALFIRKNTDKHFPYDILIECNLGCIMYDETGKYVGEEPHAYDIVSEWKEEIDEEELYKLAEQNNPYPSYDKSDMCVAHTHDGFNEGFIACYHKALEQL